MIELFEEDYMDEEEFQWHKQPPSPPIGGSEVIFGKLKGKFLMKKMVYDDQGNYYAYEIVNKKAVYCWLGQMIENER